MTHSLHRQDAQGALVHDYVLLVMASKGINDDDIRGKLARILDIIWDVGPTNIGSHGLGAAYSADTRDEIRRRLDERPRVSCVFAHWAEMEEVLRRIIQLDCGLSVTVVGPPERIIEMSKKIGLNPHSVQLSLGTVGRTDLLPRECVLEFTTMCGHGMIAPSLVAACVSDVLAGRSTTEEAVLKLGRPCVHGLFNTSRARQLLTEQLAKLTGPIV